MFSNKVFGTLSASVLTTVFQVVLLLLTTHFLSVNHRGVISLFVLNAAIMSQVSAFCSGSLPFMVNQKPLRNLFLTSYVWNFISGPITFLVLYLFNEIESEYGWLILITGILQGLFAVNQNILLGLKKFWFFNFSQIFFHATTLAIFSLLIFSPEFLGTNSHFHFKYYMYAYTSSLAVIWILGLFEILPMIKWKEKMDWSTVKSLFKYGALIQTGTFAQQLNSRMSFFYLTSDFLVGFFSTGISIIEKLMLISRGFSTVQYPTISAHNDRQKSVHLTKSFAKMVLLLTCIGASIALFLPDSFYEFVIGSKYEDIKEIIVALSPGIILLAVSNILSHYFSGTGQFRHNTIGSIVGLIITIGIGSWMIPEHGVFGAVVTTNISYFALTLYQMVVFYRQTPFKLSDWFVTREDWKNLFDGTLD